MADFATVWRADADISGFVQNVNRMVTELHRLRRELNIIGDVGAPRATFGEQLRESARRATADLQRVKRQLDAINEAQERYNRTGQVGNVPGAAYGAAGGQKFMSIAQLNALQTAATKERLQLEEVLASLKVQAEQRVGALQERSLATTSRRVALEREIARITSASYTTDLATRRLRELDQFAARLSQIKAALQEGTISGLQERTRAKIDRTGLQASKEEAKAQAQIENIEKRQAKNQREIAQITEKTTQQTREKLHLKAQELRLEMETARAAQVAAAARVRDANQRRAGFSYLSGAAGDLQRIGRAQEVVTALTKEASEGVLGSSRDLSQLSQYQARLERINRSLERGALSTRKRNRYEAERAEILRRVPKIEERVVQRGIPGLAGFDAIVSEGTRKLSRLQNIFAGAFDGFQRRFEATLQFAISGAIIFGAQRMVREFVQAAIEVERAFKDIETALEFDIEFERGTAEFNQVVSNIRREVLSIANEFNVLPTEANKAAFVMVARFTDMNNAMKAFRAQILATKVSTIDQSEVLRALTAVAEGFAAAIFESTDAMSIQEKLLKRETIAANLYAQALDLAVLIQQKFGVETEDVLEGTARATEVFRQMGFTMVETAALVSAVSRQLGQTGQASAERLVRSIGQLTSPQIRDQLLDLAAGTDALSLSYGDFIDGATAWESIVSQFERLERLDPQAAQQLLQIVGQRREAEAVAAALGTVALQTEIIASADAATGSAERRFAFLRDTVAETIQSIVAEFQSLAQNVERLGLISPLRLFLTNLDQALSLVNGVVQSVERLINAIDRTPVIGDLISSDQVKTLLALALAARTLKAVTVAAAAGAAKKIGAAALTQGLAPAQGFVTAAGAGATAAAVGPVKKAINDFVLTISKADTTTKGFVASLGVLWAAIIRETQARLASLATSLAEQSTLLPLGGATAGLFKKIQYAGSRAAGALSKLSPAAFTGLALGLVGVGAAVITLTSAFKAAEQAAKAMSEAQDDARQRARAEALTGDLSSTAETALRSRFELENIQAASDRDSMNAIANFFIRELWDPYFRTVDEAFNESIKRRTEVGLPEATAFGFGDAIREDRLFEYDSSRFTPYTDEWWAAVTHQARQQWLKDSVAALQEEAANVVADSGTSLDPRTGYWIQVALDRARQALDAALTPEEQDVWARTITDLELRVQGWAASANEAREEVEGRVAGVMEEFGRIAPRLRLGDIDSRGARDQVFELMGKLEEMSQLPGLDATILDSISDGMLQLRQFVLDLDTNVIDRLERQMTVVGGEAYAMGFKMMSLQQKMRVLEEGTDEWFDAFIEFQEGQRQIARAAEDAVVSRLDTRLGLAQHTDEWVGLVDRLLPLYFFESTRVDRTEAERLQATAAYWNLFWEKQDRLLDEAQRTLVAQAKLSGPVGNKLNTLNAEIQGLELALAEDLDDLVRAETRVQLREKIAERNQEEFNIWAAEVRAIAGVSDSILSLNGQLTIVAAEMELVAASVGTNTAEYSNLALAQDRLENQLALAELELQVLGFKLESDLTDPLAQATINLGEIIAKLANPDLGPLERARLLVGQKNAENLVEQQFFNRELFNLRFLSETGQLGTGAYISALQALLAQVDTTSQQGREIFLQIQGVIDGLTSDISGMQFNIPGSIRLPTLFEVRRALEADSLGVNYQDNRVQEFTFNVSENVDLDQVYDVVSSATNRQISRTAPGSSTLTFLGRP